MNRKQVISLLLLSASLLLAGCSSNSDAGVIINMLSPNETYEKEESSGIEVKDLDTLYEDQDMVKVAYLTVGAGSEADGTDHSWEEINAHSLDWYQEHDEEVYRCESLLQFGNEMGPLAGEYGFGETAANSTVRLSGKGASARQQKSYCIQFKGKSSRPQGMKSVILSKSFTDPFRFTNKLAYTWMQEIDSMLSDRTCFVHLYVKDIARGRESGFADYGLYTMVEPIGKKYFSARQLDTSGEIYQAKNFDFGRHEDVIKQPTESDFNKQAFEEILEAEGSEDYSKLIAMLDAVNDPGLGTEDLVDQYFDKDNLYNWMAFNILIGNMDCATENFYLYSPVASQKFYLISWDNDKSLRADYELLKDPDYSAGWNTGIFLFKDSKLFSRILKSEECVNDLSDRIADLYAGTLAPKKVGEDAAAMAKIVKTYLYDKPDLTFARVTEKQYDQLLAALPEQITANYYAYYDSLETPWPFHILEPEKTKEGILLKWEEAEVLQGEVSYQVEVAKDWTFREPIEKTELKENSCTIGQLEPGQYFLRVTAISEQGNMQEAIESYQTEKKTEAHGVLSFYVREDGSIAASLFS